MLHLHATSESGFVKQRHNLLLNIKFRGQLSFIFYTVSFCRTNVKF